MTLLNVPSGISRAEPPVMVPPGAYGLKAQIVAPPGAGMAFAPLVAPPVPVRVEAEALVIRQSPEATAAATAYHTAEVSSLAGLPPTACCYLAVYRRYCKLHMKYICYLFFLRRRLEI